VQIDKLKKLDCLHQPVKGASSDKQQRSKQVRPGEMPEGKFHYNPGNMSGKKIGNAEREKDDVAAPGDHADSEKEKNPG
jgi:hypothetical protein